MRKLLMPALAAAIAAVVTAGLASGGQLGTKDGGSSNHNDGQDHN